MELSLLSFQEAFLAQMDDCEPTESCRGLSPRLIQLARLRLSQYKSPLMDYASVQNESV